MVASRKEPRGRPSEEELLEATRDLIARRLPPRWTVELPGEGKPADLVVKDPSKSGRVVLVEAKREFGPGDIQAFGTALWRRLRQQSGDTPILLVAPYLSYRAREMLAEENISYLDLTGNVRIALDYPGLFIMTEGAQRDPYATKPARGLRGAKVGAVVRVLADVVPPYSASDVARAAQVTEGYVSRVLETLAKEGLIDRPSRGPILGVDWPAILRRRAQSMDLFTQERAYRYVSRSGPRQVLNALGERPVGERAVVTGSFAAARLVRVATPALLAVYATKPPSLADELGLFAVEEGADTILLRPDNESVFERTEKEKGVEWAAPSQIVIDSLSGGGRMPAEGEAAIDWMRKNESRWRVPSIDQLIHGTLGPTRR